MPHRFTIELKLGYKVRRFNVIHIPVNNRVERFELTGKNKSIILESNRPLFRSKGIRHRNPTYNIIEGQVLHIASLDPFLEQIDAYFRSNVPVKFKFENRTIHGMLCQVSGAGRSGGMYHLYVDNFHWGELLLCDAGWKWEPNAIINLQHLVPYFVRQVSTLPNGLVL
ncbi:MAG: hypothetical protein EOO06_05430 [Chitinophagaceae bacterium]|nr:MAG: hypothetical protein EOO06_05430 [Chitinophagaceae bacterium]